MRTLQQLGNVTSDELFHWISTRPKPLGPRAKTVIDTYCGTPNAGNTTADFVHQLQIDHQNSL